MEEDHDFDHSEEKKMEEDHDFDHSEEEDDLVHPGPINPDVLYGQEVHISENIWRRQERKKPLETVGSNIGLKEWHLNDNQKERVKKMGFGVTLDKSNFVKAETNLLWALVERWRPETNSFHLPTGEATITLEDVAFSFDLPMGGRPVVDRPLTGNKGDPFRPLMNVNDVPDKDLKTDGLRFTYVRSRYGPMLPPEHTQEDEDMQLRFYLLDVLNSLFLPNTGKSYVHGRYVKFVMDLEEVNKYCWTSALLSHTYKALSKATYDEERHFYGCTSLIMLWVWHRIPLLSPVPRPGSELWLPRATAYAYSTKSKYNRFPGKKNGISNLFFRGELDGLDRHGSFIWEPYSRFKEGETAELALRFKNMGLREVPLIHFLEVAYQKPDRVLRQFGLKLEIPRPIDRAAWQRLWVEQDQFFQVFDPIVEFEDQIREWEESVVNGVGAIFENDPARVVSLDDYFSWYRHITRNWIHPPTRLKKLPRDKYQPRSMFQQETTLELVDESIELAKEAYNVADPVMKEKISKLNQKYENECKTWRHPDFISKLPEKDAVSKGGDDMVTPEIPPRREGDAKMSVSMPPKPIKDKGKRKAFETSSDMPSFDLGLNLSPLKNPKPATAQSKEDKDEYFVPQDVKDWIDMNWFNVPAEQDSRLVDIGGGSKMAINNLKSLAIKEELYDVVMVSYIRLLVEREVGLEQAGMRKDKTWWVCNTDFMEFCSRQYRSPAFKRWHKCRRPDKGGFEIASNVLPFLEGSVIDQPPINTCNLALIPFLHHGSGIEKIPGHSGNHYSLFVVSLDPNFTTVVVDSIFQGPEAINEFQKELDIVYNFIAPCLQHKFGMEIKLPNSRETRNVRVGEGPRQDNLYDCGVFVLKAMDDFLRGKDWSIKEGFGEPQIEATRYKIAWEIKEGRVSGYD